MGHSSSSSSLESDLVCSGPVLQRSILFIAVGGMMSSLLSDSKSLGLFCFDFVGATSEPSLSSLLSSSSEVVEAGEPILSCEM